MELFVNELEPLQLSSLDEDWVSTLVESEYLVLSELPQEYLDEVGEDVLVSTVRRMSDAAAAWRNLGGAEWATLATRAPKETRALPALLARLAANGASQWRVAVASAKLYVRLLALPGARAYGIYHSQIFTLTLSILSFPQEIVESDKGVLTNSALAREVNLLVKDLSGFVHDLHPIIQSLKLTPDDINFEEILSHLVDITGCAIVNKLNIDKLVLTEVWGIVYEIIDLLLRDGNGQPNPNAFLLLYKCLLPKFVSSSSDSRSSNSLVRASYVTYAGVLLAKYPKAALNPFSYLIQHLCYASEGLERAESRLVRASLVVGLMSLLPKGAHEKMMDWLIQFTLVPKMQHRLLALEVLCTLIEMSPPPVSDPESSTDTPSTEDSAVEKSPNEDSGVAEPSNSAAEVSTTEGNLTEDTTNSETNTNQTEAENAEDEAQRSVCETRGAGSRVSGAVSAVVGRVRDPAGAVRARAATATSGLVRAGVAHSQHVDLLVRDERAAVRRAAVSLLQSLCEVDSSSRNHLDTLAALCRDASVLVRGAAAAAVTAIAARRRDLAAVEALLAGPMQRLVDPETKIIEQVTEIFRTLVIDRLRVWDRDVAVEDPLPWLVMERIVEHNMRRHLYCALQLLKKSNTCVSVRLVDIVSTHLQGPESRQLQTLVLLAPLARLVPYTNTDFLTDYYFAITQHDTEQAEQSRDVRLVPLCLEVLGEWSQFIPAAVRRNLHTALIKTLSAGSDPASRVACAQLAANLDPDNLQWADDLVATWSMREEVEWWCAAADISLFTVGGPGRYLERRLQGALEGGAGVGDEGDVARVVSGVGRLCVRGRGAASRLAPTLAHVLHHPHNHTHARINALYALADMCVRYTCIVEPQLGVVCESLREDAPPELRRAAVATVTRLLLGGYLRLRAPLYYSYCALIADPDPEVREPPEYYVTSCLGADVVYRHMVDTVVAYTRPDADPKLSNDDRHLIYDVMLQRLSLVQRLNVQVRLAREVLQRADDEWEEDLEPGLHAALLDTIAILCGPRMKIPQRQATNAVADADLDELQEIVTTNIVSHKMKVLVATEVVPPVLALYGRVKGRSGGAGGHLGSQLVRLGADLVREYHSELRDAELADRVSAFIASIQTQDLPPNARHLLTHSAPPDPETPKKPRQQRRRRT